MAAFKHLALVKAYPAYSMPFPQELADLTEFCYLAAAVHGTIERLVMQRELNSEVNKRT